MNFLEPLETDRFSVDTCAKSLDAAKTSAMEWVLLNLPRFDPFSSGKDFTILAGQRVTELATMLYSYAHINSDRESSVVTTIADALFNIQENPAFRDRMVRSPAEFILFADLCGVLSLFGIEAGYLRSLSQKLVNAGFLDQIERVPHRMMDVRMTLEWSGLHHDWPSQDVLIGSSICSKPFNPALLDEASIYSLTHVIMFYYEFGVKAGLGWPCGSLTQTGEAISALLVSCCQEKHWDLVGELLLCWECLGLGSTGVYERVWSSFLSAQRGTGAFLGPEKYMTEERVSAWDGSREFELCYHTTMIAIIAVSVRLRNFRADACDCVGMPPQLDTRNRPLTDGEIHSALLAGKEWLDELHGKLGSDCGYRVLSDIAVGMWICDSMSGGHESAEYRSVLSEIKASGAPAHNAPVSSANRLVVSSLVSQLGGGSAFDIDYVADVVSLLTRHDWSLSMSDWSLHEKALLVEALVADACFPRVDPALLSAALETLRMHDDRDTIEQLFSLLGCVVEFGTAPAGKPPAELVRVIHETLSGMATHSLRQHDLMAAGKAIRLLNYYSHVPNSLLETFAMYQRPEGSFGFLGPCLKSLLDQFGSSFNVEASLYLPITVECLWTMRECASDHWRLYGELPALMECASAFESQLSSNA